LTERCQDFSADRGYDDGTLKAALWDVYRIRPLIDTRQMWQDEKKDPGYDPSKPISRSLYPDRVDTVVYSEKGEVSYYCPKTNTVRAMAFQGFESDRDTLKYRCPAAAYGCSARDATSVMRSPVLRRANTDALFGLISRT